MEIIGIHNADSKYCGIIEIIALGMCVLMTIQIDKTYDNHSIIGMSLVDPKLYL